MQSLTGLECGIPSKKIRLDSSHENSSLQNMTPGEAVAPTQRIYFEKIITFKKVNIKETIINRVIVDKETNRVTKEKISENSTEDCIHSSKKKKYSNNFLDFANDKQSSENVIGDTFLSTESEEEYEDTLSKSLNSHMKRRVSIKEKNKSKCKTQIDQRPADDVPSRKQTRTHSTNDVNVFFTF